MVGGRWNSPGRPVVYTSTHASLAVLEKLVWLDPEDLPEDLELFEIEMPDEIVPEIVELDGLPEGWAEPGSPDCIKIGDRWLRSAATVALSVPSAVIPDERNVLLNPRHPDAERVRVVRSRRFAFDSRLL